MKRLHSILFYCGLPLLWFAFSPASLPSMLKPYVVTHQGLAIIGSMSVIALIPITQLLFLLAKVARKFYPAQAITHD